MIDILLAPLLAAHFLETPVEVPDAHAELLEAAARLVPPGAAVLDAGCGLGLLLDHLPPATYLGIDGRPSLIDVCRRWHAARAGAAFERADLATAALGVAAFDVIAILDAAGLDTVGLLRRARGALRPGGRVLVAGPSSPERFALIEDGLLARRRTHWRFADSEAALAALQESNRLRLTDPIGGWSAEGMAALLAHLGYGDLHYATNRLYDGAAYLVAAGR
jgi:SAM-dependent methyltransferase